MLGLPSAAVGTSKRERQKQARQDKIEQLRSAEEKAASRKRTFLIVGGVVAFVAFAIGYSILTADDDADVATDTTTTEPLLAGDDDTDTSEPEDPTETTASTVPAVIPGTEPCPPADGSAERTLTFDDTFEDCLEEGVDYQARFTTTEGEVLVDLLEDEMPNTVNSFVALVRYGYYDDTLLFRTDPSIDIIQGGSPTTQDNTDPGPGFTLPDTGGEFRLDPTTGQYTGPFTYAEGQLIMARSAGPDSSGGQFFFSTGPNVSLLDSQGTYLLFGDVLEGLDVLQAIIGLHEEDPTSGLGGAPSRDVTVERVEILEL